MPNPISQKTYAFIDSQNLHLGILHSNWELDYKKFRNYLRTKYHVAKAYIFIGYVPKNTNLYKYLQEAGFILSWIQVSSATVII